MGRFAERLLAIARTLPTDQRRRVVEALVHSEGPPDRAWQREWRRELHRRVAGETDRGAAMPWHDIEAAFAALDAERSRWPQRPAASAPYVSLPDDGDTELDAGSPADWYTSTCSQCGMPTGPRNERPLALGTGSGRAWVIHARMRAPGAVRRVPTGRTITLVRERLAERLADAVPGIEPALRPTTRDDVFEFVSNERLEPVGRPNCPWDRAGFRCPHCQGLFETRHDDHALGVCLDGARPPFFSYDIADRQRLFIRKELFGLLWRGKLQACLRAFDVPKTDATSLRAVARSLPRRTGPAPQRAPR